MGPKHEKKKKIPPKKHLSRPAHAGASKVAGQPGGEARAQQKLDHAGIGSPCSEKKLRGVAFYPKVVKDNLRLAKEYYWCDERSFYEMQVPFEEAAQFALASFNFQDADPEIFNFLPRVRRAQIAAKRYCSWLIYAARMGV